MRQISVVCLLVLFTAGAALGSGLYAFDEGGGIIAADSSGQGNDGAITGASYVSGPAGGSDYALHFSAVNDNVLLPQSVLADFSTTAYVEAMIRPTSYPGGPLGCEAEIMRKRADFNDWAIALVGDGEIYTYLADGSRTFAIGVTGGLAPLNVWTKVASFYDGSAIHLYVNDVEVASQTGVVTPDWSAVEIEIGNDTFDTGINCGDYGFKGDIDDVRIVPSRCVVHDEFDEAALPGGADGWYKVQPYPGSTIVTQVPGTDSTNADVLALGMTFPGGTPVGDAGEGRATEIGTNSFRSFGTYSARIRPSPKVLANDGTPAGVVSAFFTYYNPTHGPGLNDEIDIEFLSWEPSIVYLTVWTTTSSRMSRRIDVGTGRYWQTSSPSDASYSDGGELRNFMVPGFNASQRYRTYGFDWSVTGVRFWIDLGDGNRHELWYLADESGALIPQHASAAVFNIWHTDTPFYRPANLLERLLSKKSYLPPASDAVMVVDRVDIPSCEP